MKSQTNDNEGNKTLSVILVNLHNKKVKFTFLNNFIYKKRTKKVELLV